MPHSHAQAKHPGPFQWTRPRQSAFAACVLAAYALTCLPLLCLRSFDPSVFVAAGDRYVAQALTHPTLRVKAGSDGYDGQFYYRLSVQPLSTARQADGIAFDNPMKRTARILYPLLAWTAALGQAAAAAWSLIAINLVGLGVIAWLAVDLTRRLQLSATLPLAIVLWPGFVVTLVHDTTEITAAAFLLAAVSAFYRRHIVAYAVFASCAALARETTLPAWMAFAGSAMWHDGPQAATRSRLARLALYAPICLFAAWRCTLLVIFRNVPHGGLDAADLGWPFIGALTRVWESAAGAVAWASTPLKILAVRAYVLCSSVSLLTFLAFTAATLRPVIRKPDRAAIATAALATLCLMALLSARGPWIDPVAYLRAFTECYILACLCIAAAGAAFRRWVIGTLSLQAAAAWMFCMLQLR